MKYIYIFLFALTLSACNRTKYVEFTGTTPGINSGAFVIKDSQGTPIVSEIIIGGKFHTKNILQRPGYYDLFITGDLQKEYKKHVYEVYLEAGAYTIEADADKLYLYPTIKSSSKTQNELSDYYTAAAEKTHDAESVVQNQQALLYDKNSPAALTSTPEQLQDELNTAISAFDKVQADVLGDYIAKHPDNDIAAHLLAQIDYKKEPLSYYNVYQEFSPAQKNSVDGKSEGDDLKQLVKLATGAVAPQLAGLMPDGKAFDPKSITKKIILVEFWRADSKVSRLNHNDLLNGYYSPLKNKNFAIVSVSLDIKKEDWIAAVKEDKMTWPQVCDLKGEASANMTNWGISTIPTYDLLDGNWRFIKRDVDFNQVPAEVAKYLKTTIANEHL